MQLVRVLVADERRADVYTTLEEMELDYVVLPGGDRFETESVVEIPISDEGVGDVTDSLNEAGIDLDRYLVVEELRHASTPNAKQLRQRYADTYDRPSDENLRSQVDKLNWDVRSFTALMSLSATVAAVGLLLDSPVIVVGAAVIAPLVNPMIVTGIGTILGEHRMIRDGVRLQALGLVAAVVSAFAVGLAAQSLLLVPSTLELTALDLFETRFAPSALVVLVGVVSGVAAVVSLTAESSLINIVGVMVAAALIPAAAGTGVALAWGYPVVAFGSALLVVATMVAIDLGILASFLLLGYRPSGELLDAPSRRGAFRVVATALVLGMVLVGTGGATAGQVAFERDVNAAVDDVVSDPEYEGLSTVAVRSQHAAFSPLEDPETVTVEVRRTDGEAFPNLADRIVDRIAAETGREVAVRIEFVDGQESP